MKEEWCHCTVQVAKYSFMFDVEFKPAQLQNRGQTSGGRVCIHGHEIKMAQRVCYKTLCDSEGYGVDIGCIIRGISAQICF